MPSNKKHHYVPRFYLKYFSNNSEGKVLGIFNFDQQKYIEAGNLGGKGSDVHTAAVVGDTVGDPMKDTSGPSLNILIKLSAILSLVFAPFFVQYGGILVG